MSGFGEPPSVRGPTPGRRGLELTAAVAAALLVVFVAWAVPWLRFVLTIAAAKGIAVLGIILLLRAGQVSFGHALYLAVAAYTAAFLAPVAPDALVLLPVAVAAAALAGLLVGLFVVRYREIFFAMLNLALSMVFYSLLEKLYRFTHGTDGIRLPPLTFAGLELSADAQGWVSAALAGIGGTLVALTTRQVTPSLAYWTTSGELVFIAILGGAGSAFGPFLGAAAYELTRVYAAATFAAAWQMILGTVLLLVILFAPGGLWGIARAARARRRKTGDATGGRP